MPQYINMDEGTIDRYLDRVLEVFETQPSWRIGQCHANTLWAMRKDLSLIVPQDCDPFYIDQNVPNYVAWLRKVW